MPQETRNVFNLGTARSNAILVDHFDMGDEESVSIFTSHERFRDQVVWRYCSLDQLIDLVSSGSLYMPRGDCFEDRYEGCIFWIDETKLNEGTEACRKFAKSRYQQDYFVSCWHMNRMESLSWWEKYGHGKKVAIKSSVGAIRESIEACTQRDVHHLLMAQVRYITSIPQGSGLGSSFDGSFEPFAHKDRDFQHEREFRIIGRINPDERHRFSVGNPHLRLNVDVTRLIDAVVISPFASSEEEAFIRGGLLALNPTLNIETSALVRAEQAEELDFKTWMDKFFPQSQSQSHPTE